jgi:regulator of sirC expression with transglutaminase-like and TPR domain
MSPQVKETFAREVAKSDQQLNLAYAALLFAEYLTTPFDVSLYLAQLDEMAESIEEVITTTESDRQIIKAFNRYLFKDLKFSGNIKNYYSPHNSFLNKVLDLRTGIPISLSAIYLEVGWRVGLPVWGIGLPGHFIIGYGSPDTPIYIDVFGAGRILSEDECIALTRGRLDRHQMKAQYLKPVSKKAILHRMLLNLKQIYVGLENWPIAYKVVDLMLTVYPNQASEIRDRGLIAYRLDRLHPATLDLERYLFLTPNTPDAEWLKQRIELMEEQLLRLN